MSSRRVFLHGVLVCIGLMMMMIVDRVQAFRLLHGGARSMVRPSSTEGASCLSSIVSSKGRDRHLVKVSCVFKCEKEIPS